MAIKEVTAYQTDDGSVFHDKLKAYEHEAQHELTRWLIANISFHNVTAEEVAAFLMEKRFAVRTLLDVGGHQ